MAVNKYVIQRRFQTDLVKKVGGALGKMFEYIDGNSLQVNEEVAVIEPPLPLTKRDINKLCVYLLERAKEDGDTETLSFECVPYSKSIRAKAEVK